MDAAEIEIEVKHTEQLTRMISEIQKLIAKGISPETEKRVAKIVVILSEIEKSNNFLLNAKLDLAITSLSCERPNHELADEIILDLENRLSTNLKVSIFAANFVRKLDSPLALVLFGMFFFLGIAGTMLVVNRWLWKDDIVNLGFNYELMVLVGILGCTGSFLSMMTRLHTFEEQFYNVIDKRVLFLTGMFKPFIGTVFALVIYCIIKSDFIPIMIEPDKEKYFFVGLGFIAGFSERFARDVITKTEDQVLLK